MGKGLRLKDVLMQTSLLVPDDEPQSAHCSSGAAVQLTASVLKRECGRSYHWELKDHFLTRSVSSWDEAAAEDAEDIVEKAHDFRLSFVFVLYIWGHIFNIFNYDDFVFCLEWKSEMEMRLRTFILDRNCLLVANSDDLKIAKNLNSFVSPTARRLLPKTIKPA